MRIILNLFQQKKWIAPTLLLLLIIINAISIYFSAICIMSSNNNLPIKYDKKKELTTDLHKSTFEIDFGAMNIVSIERTPLNGQAITILGYIKGDRNIEQWHFFCSQEEHEKLARKYQEYLGKKY